MQIIKLQKFSCNFIGKTELSPRNFFLQNQQHDYFFSAKNNQMKESCIELIDNE